MLCDICHKNEATIHIQEFVDGKKKSQHICQECAVKKEMSSLGLGEFNLAQMLYNMSEGLGLSLVGDQPSDDNTPETAVVKCPQCSWDSRRFSKTGRLGCPECYNVFSDILMRAIEDMHRGVFHCGKQPGVAHDSEKALKSLRLISLQKSLEEAVKLEEYEKAARLRDEIEGLKKS